MDSKPCCSPSAQREPQSSAAPSAPPQSGASADRERPMVALPGGTFLMGTNYAHAFPADGEGPVRPVTLSPFRIDTFPVTNRDFAAFVDDTGYKTESEIFA